MAKNGNHGDDGNAPAPAPGRGGSGTSPERGNAENGGASGASDVGAKWAPGTSQRIDEPTRNVGESPADSGTGRSADPRAGSGAGSGSGQARSDTGKRGRGRPLGSTKGRAGATRPADAGTAPREVKLSLLKGGEPDEKSKSIFTDQFITEGWGLLFLGAAYGTQDPEWRLSETEANDLTERTTKLIKSVDKKALEKFEKRFAKYAPGVSFVIGLGGVIAPRIRHTQQKRKAERAQFIQEQERSRSGSRATPAASSGQASDTRHDARATPIVDGPAANGSGPTPTVASTRPVSRSEFYEISGDDG